jgi:hypothetical protein
MWADAPAFRDYVESVTRYLIEHGVDRVVFMNAHGSNVDPLREVGHRLRDDEALYAIEWIWNDSMLDLVDELFEHPGPHDGPKETALVQRLVPDLGHEDRLTDARDGGVIDVTTNDTIWNGARSYYDAIDNTPRTSSGTRPTPSPRKASNCSTPRPSNSSPSASGWTAGGSMISCRKHTASRTRALLDRPIGRPRSGVRSRARRLRRDGGRGRVFRWRRTFGASGRIP